MSHPNRRDFIKCAAGACAAAGLGLAGLGCAKSKSAKTETQESEIIACCGIACHECGAYIATQANDDVKRKAVAEEWAKLFNPDIKPEDINCDGCLSEGGRLFSHCEVCELRKCAREKQVVNCAHCTEYPCEKIAEFHKMVPDAKVRLDKIHADLS